MHEHDIDEALESFWELRERGQLTAETLAARVAGEVLGAMRTDGCLFADPGGELRLSEKCEARARDIVRRHRLAERLFNDVLDLTNYEEDACHFEHVISKDVEEALCAFLGHPPTCPHEKPIPRGDCCSGVRRKVVPLVQRMCDMEEETKARILFITSELVDRLGALGIVPGETVRIVQRRPTLIIKVEETTIALERDLAKNIFARPVAYGAKQR